jgi:MerR family transcriptional regulator, light-induced transcriptional regulator
MSKKPHSAPGLDAAAFQRGKSVFAAREFPMSNDAVHALAAEVITRLSHRHAAVPQRAPSDGRVHADPRIDARIDALCRALLALDDQAATDIVLQAHAEGASVDSLYLEYLAEAARRLGWWWEEDRVSSVEVVIAAGRVYAIMRGLRRLFGPGDATGTLRPRAIFAATPGETHTLGVTMAADHMGRHGWEIDLRAGLSHEDLVAEIAGKPHAIVGLSASSPRLLFPLARLVVALRVVNPGAWIMVSGRLAEIEPDLAHLVDADAVAVDLGQAVRAMEGRLNELAARGNAPG